MESSDTTSTNREGRAAMRGGWARRQRATNTTVHRLPDLSVCVDGHAHEHDQIIGCARLQQTTMYQIAFHFPPRCGGHITYLHHQVSVYLLSIHAKSSPTSGRRGCGSS